MTPALTAAALWAVIATFIALLPSKRGHWPAAYGLIATGLPIVLWVGVQNGPFVAALTLAAGASVLRWPLIYLWRWLKRRTG